MKFETRSKPISKGTKTKFTVLCDGLEIGSRTSGRPYRFALVVTRSQAWALDWAKRNAKWHRDLAAQYLAISQRDETAIAAHRKEGFSFASIESSIADGNYAKWAVENTKQAESCDEMTARLASGPQPEYALPFVASWHQARKNVPTVGEHHIFVSVVEVAL